MQWGRNRHRVDEELAAQSRARVASFTSSATVGGIVSGGQQPPSIGGDPWVSSDGDVSRAGVHAEALKEPGTRAASSVLEPADLPEVSGPGKSRWIDRWILAAQSTRFALERGHVVVIVTVLVLGLVGAALLFGVGKPRAVTPVAERVASGAPAEDAASNSPTSEASSRMVVHVAGLVAKPGVVELPSGSRVIDAVQAAGGETSEADLTPINLARVLNDGEQVIVPGKQAVAQESATSGESVVSPRNSEGNGLVNLNTARSEDLETLPGIGPALAERIVQWREENGQFTSVDELREVSGIGEKRFDDLESLVTV